mmetsp:Transcript_16722/g.26822  ORF Transcript_16722/g.26822 Transcript_16722/m.26822 type:complete len:258 (-) Transcript_16722:124-897(-)
MMCQGGSAARYTSRISCTALSTLSTCCCRWKRGADHRTASMCRRTSSRRRRPLFPFMNSWASLMKSSRVRVVNVVSRFRAARTEEATRELKASPGRVRSGVPAHKTSIATVCPLMGEVSRTMSARAQRRTKSMILVVFVRTTRSFATPPSSALSSKRCRMPPPDAPAFPTVCQKKAWGSIAIASIHLCVCVCVCMCVFVCVQRGFAVGHTTVRLSKEAVLCLELASIPMRAISTIRISGKVTEWSGERGHAASAPAA